MIIEVIVASAALLASAAIARGIAARRSRHARERRGPVAADARSEAPRALRVGDVLLHAGEELWLAGAIELDEEGRRTTLFRAPDSARAGWVGQLDEEGSELALLSETCEVPEGSVPDRLPVGGRVLALRRRSRVRVRAEGELLPSFAPRAHLTILADAAGRTLVVLDFEGSAAGRLALVGDAVARSRFDVLPGGDVARRNA